MTYETCHECAVALVNGDMTSLEYSHCSDVMDRIVATMEVMPLVTLVEEHEAAGYFECYVCGEVCLGTVAKFKEV